LLSASSAGGKLGKNDVPEMLLKPAHASLAYEQDLVNARCTACGNSVDLSNDSHTHEHITSPIS
jgi:hypothetical protein